MNLFQGFLSQPRHRDPGGPMSRDIDRYYRCITPQQKPKGYHNRWFSIWRVLWILKARHFGTRLFWHPCVGVSLAAPKRVSERTGFKMASFLSSDKKWHLVPRLFGTRLRSSKPHSLRYFFREVSSSPERCDSPLILRFVQAHLWDTPFATHRAIIVRCPVITWRGDPAPKDHPPQFAQRISEQFVQIVPPFLFKISRNRRNLFVQTVFIWVGECFWVGCLPLLKQGPNSSCDAQRNQEY